MKRIYITVLMLAALVTACELPDNINPKAPSEAPVATVATNAMVDFANQVDELNVNRNVCRLLSQYFAEVTYTDESRYLFADRQIPDNYWDDFYRDVLMDLNEAKNLYAAVEGIPVDNAIRDNKIAILDVIEVYVYQVLVDAFGNVPYSQTLMGDQNVTPVYDDAAGIYNDLFTRLNADIAQLEADGANGSFGSEDVFFGGDVDMWIKAAASLKLRLAMRIADVNASTSQTQAEDAIATGLFEDGDSWELVYTGVTPHVNAIYNHYSVDQRKDYVPTNTLIDIMNATNDPRRPLYATTAPDTTAYIGMEYGLAGGDSYQNFSHFSDQMFEATFPAVMLDYPEVEFLLAEAAQRGYSTPMSAAAHYNAAITASVVAWGGDASDAASFIANDVPYDAANWRESLGTQKWVALYNRGIEGWAEWRKFDFPVLHVPEDLTAQDIPLRMPYPFNEKDLNGTNYDAAATAIGGDEVGTQLFWDATPYAK